MMSSPVPIGRLFPPISFPSGNDPDDGIARPETAAYDESAQLKADPQHQKTVLVNRVVWVEEPDRVLVKKNGLRLLKGYAVLAFILPTLRFIPLKLDVGHVYNVRMASGAIKSFLWAW